MIHMGVARKWDFSTSGGAANLGGVSGDLFQRRGSGIPLLEITSLFMHKLTGLIGRKHHSLACNGFNIICIVNLYYYNVFRYTITNVFH